MGYRLSLLWLLLRIAINYKLLIKSKESQGHTEIIAVVEV
jgi:hypothetical protein